MLIRAPSLFSARHQRPNQALFLHQGCQGSDTRGEVPSYEKRLGDGETVVGQLVDLKVVRSNTLYQLPQCVREAQSFGVVWFPRTLPFLHSDHHYVVTEVMKRLEAGQDLVAGKRAAIMMMSTTS